MLLILVLKLTSSFNCWTDLPLRFTDLVVESELAYLGDITAVRDPGSAVKAFDMLLIHAIVFSQV